MKMSTEVKEHIAGMIFYSALSIPITSLIFILAVFIVTDWNGVQEHVGECIIASAIVTLGWFHQLSQ